MLQSETIGTSDSMARRTCTGVVEDIAAHVLGTFLVWVADTEATGEGASGDRAS